MEHLYQVFDCESTEAALAHGKDVLNSRQEDLHNHIFEEAKSGDNLAAIFSKMCALPIYISPQYLDYIQQVSSALHITISDILSRWWDDPNLSSLIPLDPKIERLLKRLNTERVCWRSGSWRPDFLIEETPKTSYPAIKICEINARFGFNGFFMSAGGAKFYRNSSSRLQPAFSKFSTVFGHVFDDTKPVHVLKGRETGYDIHHLRKELSHELFFVEKSQLHIRRTSNGNILLHVIDGEEVEVSQIVLELHQDEITSIPDDLLWEISIRSRINDMRTIMLVHDKRMLAIVRMQLAGLVQSQVLSVQAAALLESSIAETFLPGTAGYNNALGSSRDQDWLFKPAGSGKGAGIVFRSDLSEEDWQSFVSASKPTHVLQKGVRHQPVDLMMPVGNVMHQVPWGLVGTFFIIDGYFSGFGPWRSSAHKICALSRGGSWMMGVCDRHCLPLPEHPNAGNSDRSSSPISAHSTELLDFPPKMIDAFSSAHGKNPTHVEDVHRSLEEHGLALVRLNFNDPGSDYLVTLVRDGFHPIKGHGLPLDHSHRKGWLWDVKPVHGKVHSAEDPLARSETMHIFPWHTDCSFEANPPRYFALHVLHSDRYGGGALSIVRSRDIVQELSEQTISTLSKPEFIFAVPDEFDKGVSNMLAGSLLDMSAREPKLRYREDIISPITKEAKAALDELGSILDTCQSSSGRCLRKIFKAEDLPDGMVIIVDNARWLHARSQVNDPYRHLRRVRWNAQPFPLSS